MDQNDIKKVIRIAKPLLWYYAVTGITAMLPGFARMNVSARVAISSLICIPLLAWWYAQECGHKSAGSRQILYLAGCALACFLVGAALSALSAYLMEVSGMYARFSNTIQEGYSNSPAIWLILGPGLLAPICEELVFRGLLYGKAKKEMPALAAALVSSFLFAIGHGNVIQFIYAFPMGLLLCAVSELPRGISVREGNNLTGVSNILLPIMLHLGANLYSVAAALGYR